jgi:hypothetical protein
MIFGTTGIGTHNWVKNAKFVQKQCIFTIAMQKSSCSLEQNTRTKANTPP